MKLLRSFLLFVVTLILLLVAFNFAASGLWRIPPDPIVAAIHRWIVPPPPAAPVSPAVWRVLWALAGAIVIAIWALTIAIWRRRPRAILTRSADGESVLIHPGALLKFVHIQIERHPAVVSQKVRIRQRGSRGISIWVLVNVQPLDSLPNIKRQIEDSIRNGFSQVLGIEKIDDLTIIIGLDEKTLNHRPGPTGAPEPKPEPPVRGSLELKPEPRPEIKTEIEFGRAAAPPVTPRDEEMPFPLGGAPASREPESDQPRPSAEEPPKE